MKKSVLEIFCLLTFIKCVRTLVTLVVRIRHKYDFDVAGGFG